MPYQAELELALKAVRLGANMAWRLDEEMTQMHPSAKPDKSPVTAADFAIQILITSLIQKAFPLDGIVAEESADMLIDRKIDTEAVARLLDGKVDTDPSNLIALLQRNTPKQGSKRFWTIDPIDGTRAFVNQSPYCIALALLEDYVPKISVVACPKTYLSGGTLLYAVAGQGCYYSPLDRDSFKRAHVSQVTDLTRAVFTEPPKSRRVDQDATLAFKDSIHNQRAQIIADGQVKQCLIALGLASAYVRIPKQGSGPDAIWDVAPGSLLVQEAGGTVTDLDGQMLNYNAVPYLKSARGLVASNGLLHDTIVAALNCAHK